MPEGQAQSIQAELRQSRLEAAQAQAETQDDDSKGSVVQSVGSAMEKGIKLYRKWSMLRWVVLLFGGFSNFFLILGGIAIIYIISDYPTLVKIVGQVLIEELKSWLGIK